MKLLTYILIFIPLLTVAQVDNKKLIDSLKYIADMPYACETDDGISCGDKIFWTVVKQKQAIIPLLLDKLADTTTTKANVLYFGGQWTIGDICFTAIQEIVEGIPTFDLLGVKFDTDGCGYCAYWQHLRQNINTRRAFQAAVRNWYEKNKAGLVWVKSDSFLTCDCRGQHPNGGHFEIGK